jgi:hypothetical protein
MTGEGGVSVSPSGTTVQLMNDNIELSATVEKGAYFIEWICDPIDAGTFENPTASDTVFHAHTPIGPVTITAMFSYINPHQPSKHRNPFLKLQYMDIPLIRATRDSYSLGTKAYYAAKIIQTIVKENNTFGITDTGVDFGKLKDRSIVDTSIDLSNGVAASIIAVATGSKTFDLTAPLNLTDFSSFDQREYY